MAATMGCAAALAAGARAMDHEDAFPRKAVKHGFIHFHNPAAAVAQEQKVGMSRSSSWPALPDICGAQPEVPSPAAGVPRTPSTACPSPWPARPAAPQRNANVRAADAAPADVAPPCPRRERPTPFKSLALPGWAVELAAKTPAPVVEDIDASDAADTWPETSSSDASSFGDEASDVWPDMSYFAEGASAAADGRATRSGASPRGGGDDDDDCGSVLSLQTFCSDGVYVPRSPRRCMMERQQREDPGHVGGWGWQIGQPSPPQAAPLPSKLGAAAPGGPGPAARVDTDFFIDAVVSTPEWPLRFPGA